MDQHQEEIEVPPYFLCPISLQLMKDPVTVSTGITYDRESIEKWLFSNNNTTCPVTKQPLITSLADADFLITPNHTLRRFIQSWCTLHSSYGIERFPTPKPPASKAQVEKLIRDAKRSPQSRCASLKRLKSIASSSSANKRVLEAASGVVEFLSQAVVQGNSEEALSLLAQLHVSEDKLKKLLEDSRESGFLDSLACMMSQSSSYEARQNAVLFMKSFMEVAQPTQIASLRQEHFVSLVQLIRDQVSSKATKAALKVLYLTCPWGRNRVRAVEAGAVTLLIDQLLDMVDRRSIEMAIAVLDVLCGCAEGRAEMVSHPAGLAVVSKKLLRVSQFATERGVRILAAVLKYSATAAVVQEMVQIGVVTKLCLVLQVECDGKTKEKVKEMLRLHANAWRGSACAPTHVLNSIYS